MHPVVVPGFASHGLANRLAEELSCPLIHVERKQFPDSEVYVRLMDPVKGDHAIIVQTTNPNENLIEALLLCDAAREAGAARVTLVVPYYGYARQDRAFHPGESVSARAIAKALGTVAQELVLIDPHKEDIAAFFPNETFITSAVPLLGEVLSEWGVDLILAPDKGARDRAEKMAKQLQIPFDHMEKTRISATEVKMQAKELDVRGKRVAIVDDMIASGGTMITAAIQLKEQGATAVYAACTHGVFTNDAVNRLLAGGIDRVLCTDTLEGATCEVVSAARAVADSLLLARAS